MSAFQVSEAHVSALVTYGVIVGLVSDVESTGAMLTAENHRSIVARYKDAGAAPAFRFIETEPKTAIEIVKLCNCFDYQACETGEYDTTPAAQLVDALRTKAVASITTTAPKEIRRLPGYEAAAWSI